MLTRVFSEFQHSVVWGEDVVGGDRHHKEYASVEVGILVRTRQAAGHRTLRDRRVVVDRRPNCHVRRRRCNQ